MWQVFLILYFVLGSASYILRKILAQNLGQHNRLINAVFFAFLLPTGIILSFFFPHNLNVGALNLFFLLGGSLVWPIFYILAFWANKEVDVGVYSIISNLSPIFTLALALPFLHESLKSLQFLGVGLLILSGVLAAWSQFNKGGASNINGILICLLSTIFLGVGVAYERFMLSRIDFGAYLIYGWGSQVAWGWILAGKELKKLPQLLSGVSSSRLVLLIWGLISVIKSVFFILALKITASASIISAASDFMSVAVVVAAYFFLKEKKHLVAKILATVIGVVGLLLIAK
jgi:drug/metabolite transporter (DMT)-like permease